MSIEKVVVDNNVEKNENIEIKNPNEIVLSTGKKITKRERRGQHHIVENRLLSACSVKGEGTGVNIGDLVLASDIKTAVAIAEIDGVKQKIPTSLSEVYELASEFTYEEWEELTLELQKDKKEIEQKAKNLQISTGSGKELM
ncbi:hypothetical protein AAK894_12285 [Lachnospiraceae bacterium 46-61]